MLQKVREVASLQRAAISPASLQRAASSPASLQRAAIPPARYPVNLKIRLLLKAFGQTYNIIY